MKTDDQLEADIRAEFIFDANIKEPQEIAVSADAGRVTLRGTVSSLHQRHEAERAAKLIAGTVDVDNQLQVRLMDDWARKDADIRGAALQALEWNTAVPYDLIDVSLDSGHVKLTGTVDWHYQKQAAEQTVSTLNGVVGVRNEIEVKAPAVERRELSGALQNAFERRARTDARRIRITVDEGLVTLEGDVDSWAEHDAAIDAAYSAPGVRDVNDRLTVTG